MVRVEVTPHNWTREGDGWRWSPPKDDSRQTAQIQIRQTGDNAAHGDATARLLRTRPQLERWREYWNDGGRLDCGGWTLRDVQGFHEDNE